jgi:hypothetical protein
LTPSTKRAPTTTAPTSPITIPPSGICGQGSHATSTPVVVLAEVVQGDVMALLHPFRPPPSL